jgi:hypothetical protein
MFGVSSIFGQLRIGDSLPVCNCKTTLLRIDLASFKGKFILDFFEASWLRTLAG